MTVEKHRWNSPGRRREFVKTLATVATATFAGCNEIAKDRSSEDTASTTSGSQLPEEVRVARDKIRMAYRELGDHPLVENDRFVFDVTAFQNEFDRRKTIDNAKTAQKLLIEIEDPSEVTESVISNLNTIVLVAELQIRQRVQVFRTIQTGSMYLELLGESNFETATKVIRKARTFLANVASLGERLEAELEPIEPDLLERYDYDQFQRAQEVLTEVAMWLDPTFDGSQHFARAMGQIELASRELESDDFGTASELYGEANTYFIQAQDAFDEAHGRGRTLPRFEQFVIDLGCILPIQIRFTEEIAKASNKFENGNKKEARQMVRETLDRYHNQSEGCTSGNR